MSTPILVTGGTGTLGTSVVQRLLGTGRDVRVLSRKTRIGLDGVEYVVGDLATGTGVEESLAGIEVILHSASAKKGDAGATQKLVAAATATRRQPHLVYISIVGVDTVPFAYFRTKLAAEKVVVESTLPWTTQRATQFYDMVLSGAKNMTRLPIVPVPKDFPCQPIDPAEVADKLVELALGPPSGRVPDIGGPDVSTFAEMVRQYLRFTHRKRPVVEMRMPKLKEVRAGGLLVGGTNGGTGTSYGNTTWEQFMERRLK